MKLNENGRSMIEMLGVLGIIGIVSVGGYSMVGRSLSMQRNSQIIADAASLATSAKKLACQYDDGYTSYTYYLYQSEAYPSNFVYNSSGSSFAGVDDVSYKIDYSRSSDSEYFKMTISGINEDQCIRIASSDWGTPQSSGFLGLAIGSSDVKDYIVNCNGVCSGKNDVAVAGTSSYPLPAGNAATYCNGNNNQIQLWYKGCH